jgi:pyridoxine 4-dehydrogenase
MSSLAGKPITNNGIGMMSRHFCYYTRRKRLTALGFTRPNDPTPDDVAFRVLRAALANGANVWNGADFYGTPDANSLHLLNRYFTKYPEDAEKVVLCIKSGVTISTFAVDGSPEGMRNLVDNANKILDGKKFIDIFGCARTDPKVPVETTVKALGQLIKEGKIGGIQLSEVSADTIRRAAKVHKIDMVEAEASLWSTEIFTNGVAETCGELGIVIEAHTPLGAGILTGKIQSSEDMGTDHHKFFPRFQGESFQKNLELVEELKKFAKIKGCSPAQLAISWIKSYNGKPGMPFIVPIAGASSEERVQENCMTIKLGEDDLTKIKSILDSFPVVGARYPEVGMKLTEY